MVIPAHNEQGMIAATVRSAFEQTYRPLEIIVAVNGSTDNTGAEAEEAGARVIYCPEAGKAKAQNHVLPFVQGDVVVLVDADTTLDPDCIRLMIEDLKKGHDATCAAVMPKQTKGLYVRARRFEYALARQWWKRMHRAVGFVYVLSGCAAAVRTEALHAIGGFPHAIISEDTEMTWKLYRAGFRITYTPEALCLSTEPETWKVYRAQARRWASGSFQIIGRNRGMLKRPSTALVVLTSLWDLVWLPGTVGLWIVFGAQHASYMLPILFWIIGQTMVMTLLAARELGFKEALICLGPSKLMAFPNRGIYLCALFREWVLGKHFNTWTGRSGTKARTTKMKPWRIVVALAVVLFYGGAMFARTGHPLTLPSLPSFGHGHKTIAKASGSNGYTLGVPAVRVSAADCPNGYVGLSYDDGPGPRTVSLLRALHDNGLRATFFLRGDHVSLNPALARSVLAEGSTIGNHTWDHPDLQTLKAKVVHDELRAATVAIQQATKVTPILFRPPFGSTSLDIEADVKSHGMTEVVWDVDTKDWQGKSTDAIVNKIASDVTGGNIVLMHELPNTIRAVSGIANLLTSRGLCAGKIVPSTTAKPVKNSAGQTYMLYYAKVVKW